MNVDNLPKWVTLKWDDGGGWQYRQGFLTEYEHIERPPLEIRKPHVTTLLLQDTFRYVINGEEVIIGPDLVESIIHVEDA